jgi:hypothetical protein
MAVRTDRLLRAGGGAAALLSFLFMPWVDALFTRLTGFDLTRIASSSDKTSVLLLVVPIAAVLGLIAGFRADKATGVWAGVASAGGVLLLLYVAFGLSNQSLLGQNASLVGLLGLGYWVAMLALGAIICGTFTRSGVTAAAPPDSASPIPAALGGRGPQGLYAKQAPQRPSERPPASRPRGGPRRHVRINPAVYGGMLRDAPDGKRVADPGATDDLQVLAESGGFLHVSMRDGTQGWIHQDFLLQQGAELPAAPAVFPIESKPPDVTPPASMSTVADLERLADLRARGVLTEEEFTSAKRKVLNAPGGGN